MGVGLGGCLVSKYAETLISNKILWEIKNKKKSYIHHEF